MDWSDYTVTNSDTAWFIFTLLFVHDRNHNFIFFPIFFCCFSSEIFKLKQTKIVIVARKIYEWKIFFIIHLFCSTFSWDFSLRPPKVGKETKEKGKVWINKTMFTRTNGYYYADCCNVYVVLVQPRTYPKI